MAGNPFWAWSLRLYKRPGVAHACLALQDRAGIDVNLLLFCLWCGSRRIPLSRPAMREALRLSRRWSLSVVQPLRAVRRSLKVPALSSKALRNLRRHVAAVELKAERVQHDCLYRLARNVARIEADALAAGTRNVASYFRLAGIRLGRNDRSALATVVQAA
ncbi:MAG: TIGR02444 family protein [Alphaproteobacteria bacterium]|nr:TIGR02444 family protein [Alphaproteobacteria bacterium]